MFCTRALGATLTVITLTAFAWPAVRGPDDPPEPGGLRDRQWALTPLDARQAWRTTRGEGVVVAVLDTGVDDDHPDLAGAVIDGPDLTGAARAGPPWGRHGTAMASLIAGRGRGTDRSRGVIGIAPGARILSIRIALENDDPRRARFRGGDGRSLARGIRYAVDHGARVISMSLGCGGNEWEGTAAERRAVRYALGRGAVLVASAGNDGAGPNRRNFPAAYPGVISVGAVDEKMRVAPFSNRQRYLSVVAPGTGIITADGSRSYVIGDGTSSAAAMVSGIAALIKAEFPAMSPAQVRRAIERGATHAPAGGHDSAYGHGVANAVRALEQAAGSQRRPLRAAAPRRASGGAVRETAAGASTGRGSGEGVGPRQLVCALLVLLVLSMSARRLLKSRRCSYRPPADPEP
ncbi:type VII secretion-associated serine protease mycosin [Planobispora takensis]|uniref:Type VII secretion-associated serine protease n=1 Tax=Planobispora takensis TaxID=1367882 RepID=A0A8J3T815_9ACTN|nr:type VII secretion-associated serine protease mycosin [Planobispora takensis]GII05808.1 type VII secretion-associated serine protease [Planobispora takensis]